MEKISYLAVFEKSDDGYSIYFPDIPGCISWGETITEAQAMARDALELHLYGMEQDGEELPKPSENIEGLNADDIVVLITAYPDLFRDRRESRKVRMNVTISNHLKNLAQQENINCSQVLELALRNMLGIQQRV